MDYPAGEEPYDVGPDREDDYEEEDVDYSEYVEGVDYPYGVDPKEFFEGY